MTELKKELTQYGLIMVVIGSCIGSGIFLTPSQIAGYLPSPISILLVWAIGGIITLTGALTFSELGAMFPQAGGVYVYLKEAYGDLFGFLYGWAYLVIITSGAIAAQSCWAILLLLFWGTFEDVITYVVFIDWIFFCLTAISIFIFRYARKNLKRPYKTFNAQTANKLRLKDFSNFETCLKI